MAGRTSFGVVLQDELSVGDNTWVYRVSGLPDKHGLETSRRILSLFVSEAAQHQSLSLRLDALPVSRAVLAVPRDRILLVSLSALKLSHPDPADASKKKAASAREVAQYKSRLLRAGVELNGLRYHFFGHSNSQLKSSSCFMLAAPKQQIDSIIDGLGDFSKIRSVGKKAKRIGLMFSSAEVTLKLAPDRCKDIADVARNGYLFTDGCGVISKHLADLVVKSKNISFRNRRYLPSIYQIRYRGYKGVLTLEPRLRGETLAIFRESMRKFKDAPDLSLSVVDFAKPYAYGYLNDEIVLLLDALSVPHEVLLRKQGEHIQFLKSVAAGNQRAAFCFLASLNQLEMAERMLLEDVDSILPSLRRMVRSEFLRFANKRGEQRCRILISKSRLLFGICDPSDAVGLAPKLKSGQCFVRITDDQDGQARTIVNTEVLVSRNPCLHPGDLQKFRAVDVAEWAHLADCIVFSTQGSRSSADMMSGGDLDGDKFFVTWDLEIIPRILSEPAAYPGGTEPVSHKAIKTDERAEYFANYTNASLGKVKNLYLEWAMRRGAMSSECQELNRLFSSCVDGNRIKVPQRLEELPEVAPMKREQFILHKLHEHAKAAVALTSLPDSTAEEASLDTLEFLLSLERPAISEFEMIKMCYRCCIVNRVSFLEYAPFFDFAALSPEQQAWMLDAIPPTKFLPSLVRNGLLQSALLDPVEVQGFKLDHHRLHWKPFFDSATDRAGTFLATAARAMELFHKKLIVFRADERLTLAVYVPTMAAKATDTQVGDSVRVFALPRSSGPSSANYRVRATKKNYRLYCDEAAFELYDGKRSNTWIHIHRSQEDDSSYRDVRGPGERRRLREQTMSQGINHESRASVALDKISKDIQKHIGRMHRAGIVDAEIYVISNRDLRSMQLLDQWLELIDTEQTLPLFEPRDIEYRTPVLSDVAWDRLPLLMSRIIRDGELDLLKDVTDIKDLDAIFFLVRQHGEHILLRDLYASVMKLLLDNEWPITDETRQAVYRCLIGLLESAPYLSKLFLQSQCWKQRSAQTELLWTQAAPGILKSIVHQVTSMRVLAIECYKVVVSAIDSLGLNVLLELGELIALCVTEVDSALELLLGTLELESSRIFLERPQVVRLCVRGLVGAVLDHIDDVTANGKKIAGSVSLKQNTGDGDPTTVRCIFRIDSPLSGMLKRGDHIRLTAAKTPSNAPNAALASITAIVESSELDTALLSCTRLPPSFFCDCDWDVVHCGSFVTTKTMIEALEAFYTQKDDACGLYSELTGLSRGVSHDTSPGSVRPHALPEPAVGNLNVSQNRALEAALNCDLALLWGPPGTGKTHTIVEILKCLLASMPGTRILVTAPTHNAVDNILEKFLHETRSDNTGTSLLRVSTNIDRVAERLRQYTCDAVFDGSHQAASAKRMRAAQKKIRASRLIFTTAIGAGLGLLRDERFETVIIDEASQLTEPASLVPLSKGCLRAILVGDHVQLRPTIQQHAALVGFDVSLFERLYDDESPAGSPSSQVAVPKVMLDVQYRMHSKICEFSSKEFYMSCLKTDVQVDKARRMPESNFPWPTEGDERKVFVQCDTGEDLGLRSKANKGQVAVCKRVYDMLSMRGSDVTSMEKPRIAILTPYRAQHALLSEVIPARDVNSIDGFQGREADIVVFVTVRCNLRREIGFLEDLRRLNVALTRARYGVIIIGDRATLTGPTLSPESAVDVSVDKLGPAKQAWRRLLDQCSEVRLA